MSNYYSNVNLDLLNRIPVNARRVLEIGCGSGRMGRAFKARNPSAQYFGIEILNTVAQEARAVLDGVICADIENDLTLPSKLAPSFDTLVFGDVLEHLRDPWRVLLDLRQYIEPGGLCVACIPNVAHWSVISGLLEGKWTYEDSGLLDRTHLRFFTLDSASEMFRKSGWSTIDAKPRYVLPEKTAQALKTLLPGATALGEPEARARVNMSAFQWVIRAMNGPVQKLSSIAAIGQKKYAGVTEARVDHPMLTLQSLPETKTLWMEQNIIIANDVPAGVLILHRQVAALTDDIRDFIAKGWIVVVDMDDDPNHFPLGVESDFAAYREAHAITVSTDRLGEIIQQFNPNVQVFENAIFAIPDIAEKRTADRKLRIFFGALNRKPDWLPIIEGVKQAASQLRDEVEFVVVHDKEFHDALPDDMSKTFLPLVGIDQYTAALASCDIALLPLNDTPFNRCKSDLKLIECAAAQVAVICSKIVYALKPEHAEFAEFATTSQEWRDAILKLAKDRALIEANTAKALNYVKAKRMHAQQATQRLAYYESLIANRPHLEAQRRTRLALMTKT